MKLLLRSTQETSTAILPGSSPILPLPGFVNIVDRILHFTGPDNIIKRFCFPEFTSSPRQCITFPYDKPFVRLHNFKQIDRRIPDRKYGMHMIAHYCKTF
jgi:hypothetical protein